MTFSESLPIISSICILVLGLFVFLKSPKSKLKTLFFFLCLIASMWLFGTYIMFLNRGSESQAIFWDRFIYLVVVFSPVVFYHFSAVYCRFQRKLLINSGYILSFIFLILSRTDYFIDGLYYYPWGVHTQARLFHHFFLAYLFIYMLLVLVNFYKHYKNSEGVIKRQALYMFIAFLLFIIISETAFLPAYNIDIYYPFPYISGVVFTAVLAHFIFIKSKLEDKFK